MRISYWSSDVCSSDLYFANWRWIFGALLLIGALITGWVAFRLPETLTPENRIGISLSDIGATFANIITNRSAFGYMVAAGIAMGALVGFTIGGASCRQRVC